MPSWLVSLHALSCLACLHVLLTMCWLYLACLADIQTCIKVRQHMTAGQPASQQPASHLSTSEPLPPIHFPRLLCTTPHIMAGCGDKLTLTDRQAMTNPSCTSQGRATNTCPFSTKDQSSPTTNADPILPNKNNAWLQAGLHVRVFLVVERTNTKPCTDANLCAVAQVA